MEKIVVEATRRSVIGKQVKQLRRNGELPAVMYGFEVEPTPLTLNLHNSMRLLAHLPATSLVYVKLEGQEHAALMREKQIDFLRGTLRHIDFQVVSLKKRIRADVAIEVTGTSPAVKDFNGVVNQNINALHIEALPQDLPESIKVDVSGLVAIGDAIYVRDLVIPGDVEVHTPEDEVVVVITSAASDVIEEAAEGELTEPEVIERGKKEEESED